MLSGNKVEKIGDTDEDETSGIDFALD